MTDIKKLAEEVLEADKKATPGPWTFDSGNMEIEHEGTRLGIADIQNSYASKQEFEWCGDTLPDHLLCDHIENGEFIALSRTAAPLLAREVLRIRDLLELDDDDTPEGKIQYLREIEQSFGWMFKPQDFFEIDDSNGRLHVALCATEAANALLPEFKKQWLEELLRDAPTVYGIASDPRWEWSYVQTEHETHTAKLVDIREIGKVLGELEKKDV